MVSKEKVQARLEDLKKQRETLLANINAIAGAIQICEQLLADEDTDAEASTV
jgi:hypothetical protein